MSGDTGNIWSLTTDARYNRANRRAPAYLTPAQATRWQRITQARALYENKHYEYFIEQRRSMYEFPDVTVDGEQCKHFVPYNLLKRVSEVSADLLFGSEPLIRVASEVEGSKLKELVDRCDLHATLSDMEIDCSLAGEAILEACVLDGETYLILVPAEEIHPLGKLRPDRQFAAYVRYAEAEMGSGESKFKLILATTYREGSIERHVYREEVDPKYEVPLGSWPDWPSTGAPVAAVEPTGITVNTIIWFPNILRAGKVLSDYDGLIPLQDTLNAKQTQFARVISKHSTPKILAPRSAADEEGNLRASRDVLYADNSNEWGYLTWDAKLDMAYKDRDHAVDAICVISATSPVLLGIDRGGGAPESARAMRLRASPSTAKAQRKATLRRPLVRWALRVAQMLDQTIPGNRYDIGDDLGVEMRDGLPIDESELVDTAATGVAGNVMSIERAVEIQIPGDRDAQAMEVGRIKKKMADDAAAAQPDFLGDEPSARPQITSEPTADDTSTEAA